MLPTPCVSPYTWQQPDSSVSSTDTLPVPQGDRDPIPEHDAHRRGRRSLLGFGSRTSEEIPGFEHDCDYEKKYEPDEEYKEMGPNARIWLTYLDESRIFDTQKCEEWQDGLGALIVFASLFTIVVSIFCSHSYKFLLPDNTLMLSALFTEMIQIQRAIADGTPIEDVPRADTTFTPMMSDVWVIALWYTSHALSLSVAIVAMLAKQWIRQYMILPSADARQRARTRHFRYMALQKWRVPEIIDFLPVLMHVAFSLFCVGLIIFLFTLHTGMAIVVTSVFAALFVVCIVIILLPVFNPECPYKTPLAVHAFDVFNGLRGRRSNETDDFSENRVCSVLLDLYLYGRSAQ
ncbi:hypothetical protein BDZ89DRAFT_1161347 [Hymenopellis radicata]|nr:hypothetical protein BDZ89DRAFT_1161347 [Hymenopellis radicata]